MNTILNPIISLNKILFILIHHTHSIYDRLNLLSLIIVLWRHVTLRNSVHDQRLLAMIVGFQSADQLLSAVITQLLASPNGCFEHLYQGEPTE